jgi:hypothetical protein
MLDRGYATIVFGFDWLLLQQGALRFIDAVKEGQGGGTRA